MIQYITSSLIILIIFNFNSGSSESSCNRFFHFECNNHECINKIWTCDNYPDCSDGSDEYPALDCSRFKCNQKTHYQCRSGQCIPQKWVCDAWADCPGGDDESCLGRLQDILPKSRGIDH